MLAHMTLKTSTFCEKSSEERHAENLNTLGRWAPLGARGAFNTRICKGRCFRARPFVLMPLTQ